MATTSFTALRRFAGIVFTMLLSGACLCVGAAGQAPLVVPSVTTGLTHPAGWGTIYDTALDIQGDWLVVDYAKGTLYEFPAGGGAAVALVPVGTLSGYQNPGVAVDSSNNLYIEGNWSNCLLQFPYNWATGTWPGLATLNNTSNASSNCAAPYDFAQYGLFPSNWQGDNWGFQPWGLAVDKNNRLWIANQVSGNWDFTLGVNGTAPVQPIQTIYSMQARASSVAVDPWLNSYYVEEPDNVAGNNPPCCVGVLELTAAQYQSAVSSPPATGGAASDKNLVNVAPAVMAATSGIATDLEGNLYASDQVAGVYLIPNPSGTPDTAAAIQLTALGSQGAGAVDAARHIVYIPINNSATKPAPPTGVTDVEEMNFGYAEFGASNVGTATKTPVSVNYTFYGSVTPAQVIVVEDGVSTPDFAITGATCALGTAYGPSGASGTSCAENITFTPHSVGSISANLLMQTAQTSGKTTTYTTVASIPLHGTGLGANIFASPSLESPVGAGLKTPSQIATDIAGNIYVADAGQKQVLMYAPGSGASAKPVSIGTGLTAPTGVAVDGAGDVFIADSGNVYEVPFGLNGLNAAGQTTVASGLGSNLRLAADGLGSVYVADPMNARVVRLGNLGQTGPGVLGQTEIFLTNGFTAPSYVAVDSNNNLYVIDGVNLFEVPGGEGAPATWMNTLSGATGLAVDPSGAVYITSGSATERIPYLSGALAPADAATIASDVTGASSVALDHQGNVYLTAAAGGSVRLVSTSGTLNFGTLTGLTQTASLNATITNIGNAPLATTGYTSTNAVDYTAADGTCIAGSPVPPGGTCEAAITLNPGPGEQGTLTGQIGLTSNSLNSPVVNVTGVGAALSASTASLTAGSAPEAVNTPFSVTVTPKSGSGTPTGTVTVSFPSWTVPSTGYTPVTATATATLANGAAKFNLSPVAAGSDTFTVAYSGDRVYGKSTATATVTVAKSAITGLALPVMPDVSDTGLPYVMPSNGTGASPYDSSGQPWQYSFQVNVNTAAGIPTGTLTFMDNSSACPPGTSASGQGVTTCALMNYTGPACPANGSGASALTIQNAGGPTGAQASFSTACLYQVPANLTYTPVIFTHYITPVYSGDQNFLGATGATPTLFQALRGPLVQITTPASSSATTAPSLTIQSGSTASVNLTLTSILGYGIVGRNGTLHDSNFPVTLACSNLPPHSACSFSYPNPDAVIPAAVDISCPASATAAEVAAGQASCSPGQVTVTFNTNVTAGTTTSRIAQPAPITLAAIFGLGMIGLFFRRKAFEKGRRLLTVFLMIVGGAWAVSITACNTTYFPAITTTGTPSGTYAVTITAQQVGTQCISSGDPSDNCIVAGSGATQPNGFLIYGSEDQVSLPFTINVTVQ